MDINSMTMEQLETRSAEILSTMEGKKGDELEALKLEAQQIAERKAELAEIEKREAQARELSQNNGMGTVIFQNKENKNMERSFAIDSAEYRDAWLKNLMGKQLDAEERAAITGTDAIPTETANKIVTRLNENALIGKVDMTYFPGYYKIPVYATNNDATWTDSSTDSQDVIANITLQPHQLIKTIEVPATVDKMSISAFEAYIVKALANKIESALQKAIICGTGSTEPTGIITVATSKTGTFTKAAASKADLLAIMGDLPADYQNGAVWIMPSKVFYAEAMAIANAVDFAAVNGGFKNMLFGHEVILDDNAQVSSKDAILYGNPKAYHVNMGEGIEIAADDSVGFRNNSRVYRGVCLADGNLDNSNAFVKYTRAAS